MSEQLWRLKQCNMFRQLPPEQLNYLERSTRARKFPRGAPIYLPADYADGVLLLAEGRVKIGGFTEEGKQTILAFIEPGELFGEMALVGATERDEYAEAVEKSNVVLIPRQVMEDLLTANPTLSLGITKLFGFRRQRIERRLKSLLFKSNRERLIHLLLELAEQYGRQTHQGVELKIKLSHQDLANIIGSTRETVSVVLGEMQNEGKLVLGRRKIVMTDMVKLADSIKVPTPRLSQA